MTTSASAVGLEEDKAYLLHHFNCPTCISVGATLGKQARCPDGAQLWRAYNLATEAKRAHKKHIY